MRSSPLLAQPLGATIGLGVALLRLLANALTRSIYIYTHTFIYIYIQIAR